MGSTQPLLILEKGKKGEAPNLVSVLGLEGEEFAVESTFHDDGPKKALIKHAIEVCLGRETSLRIMAQGQSAKQFGLTQEAIQSEAIVKALYDSIIFESHPSMLNVEVAMICHAMNITPPTLIHHEIMHCMRTALQNMEQWQALRPAEQLRLPLKAC